MTAGAKGFTLLEAIVALAVLALALVPMVAFVSQSANELLRAGESNERSFVMQSALALMEPINPMVEAQGSLALDRNITMTWDSTAIVEPNPGINVGAGLIVRPCFSLLELRLRERTVNAHKGFACQVPSICTHSNVRPERLRRGFGDLDAPSTRTRLKCLSGEP